MHQAFVGKNEQKYKYLYETAELNGFMARDCQKIYFHCEKSPFEFFTKVIF